MQLTQILQFLICLLLLCHCATKHQPMRFGPHFSSYPEELFSTKTIAEIKVLEARVDLSALEKKRLVDLYLLEIKNAKASSARFFELNEKAEKLRAEIESYYREVDALYSETLGRRENGNESDKNNFENATLKREYSQAYQLWNRDENLNALNRVKGLSQSSELKDLANRKEWMKVLNLRFRISHDLQENAEMNDAFLSLKEFDACAPETANAAFLFALSLFNKEQAGDAAKLLEGQCDKDESLGNKMKRSYWLFRFYEKVDSEIALKKYQELMSLPLPGYYTYLAKSSKGLNFELPTGINEEEALYLNSEFPVSTEVHQLLLNAEERLKAGLKRDAGLFLMKAIGLLKGDAEENTIAILYVAHLFRASGNHLEAMKAFTLLVGGEKEPKPEWHSLLHGDFLKMFPRPHETSIQWLSKLWKMDDDFIYSIMRQESAFNPGAVSSADARGLMQLMPSLAKSLSQNWKYRPYSNDKFLFKADENLKLATYHLHQLQIIAPHYALMAASYNAGVNRTSRWWQKFGHYPLDVFVEFIPINETRNYVKLVLRNFLYYKALKTKNPIAANTIPLNLPPYGIARGSGVLP